MLVFTKCSGTSCTVVSWFNMDYIYDTLIIYIIYEEDII